MNDLESFMKWLMLEAGILLATLAVFAVALEIGFRLGQRRQQRSDESDRSHASALQGAVLGLLALLLGFTFAMAVSRYELRKNLIVSQANAIGTASLRGQLLPAPYAERAKPLFREYVQSRFDYFAAGRDEAAIDHAESQAAKLEAELWRIAGTLLAEDPRSQPASLFAQSLNEVFDLRENRRFALHDRVPRAVTVLLFVVSAFAMALVSYSCGLSGHRRALANFAFAFLIALVLVIILDIDAPRVGLVSVSQDSLIRLQQSLP